MKVVPMRGVIPVLCTVLFLTGASSYIQVPATSLFSAQNSKGKSIGCAVISGKVVSGKISSKGFLRDDSSLKSLKAKLKKASGSAKKKLQAKIKSVTATAKSNTASCKAALGGGGTPPGGGGSPAPNPTNTPRPTARPTTPPQSGGCGIPSGVTGNVSRGASIWNSSCGSCHGEKTNRSYGQISASMNLPQMIGLNTTTQQRADLTAYLNRNNPQCN